MSTPESPATPPSGPVPTAPTFGALPPVAPRKPNRTMLLIGVVVAVAVVVLLIALLVLPSLTTSSSPSSGSFLTYSGALPVANSAAGGYAGGGWVPLFSIGLVTAASESVPANASALKNVTSECTITWVSSTSTLTIPGYTGNRSNGVASAWEFVYRNASDVLAIVSVINGQGMVLATLTGSACSLVAEFLSPLTGNIIDSSQAAADVEPYAAGFLAAHPNASAVYGLIGGISFLGKGVGPKWTVAYSTCALNASPSGTGAEFNATLNATSGKVLGTNSTASVACGSGSVLASPTSIGPIAISSAGALRAARTA
jgi:hypothetical protein